jgi:hypothetical protein
MLSIRLQITVKLFYLNRKKLVFIFYLSLQFYHRTLLYNYIIKKRKNDAVAGYSQTFNQLVSLVLLKCYTSIPSTLLLACCIYSFNKQTCSGEKYSDLRSSILGNSPPQNPHPLYVKDKIITLSCFCCEKS